MAASSAQPTVDAAMTTQPAARVPIPPPPSGKGGSRPKAILTPSPTVVLSGTTDKAVLSPNKGTGTAEKVALSPNKGTGTAEKVALSPNKGTGTAKKVVLSPNIGTGTAEKVALSRNKGTGTAGKVALSPNRGTGAADKSADKALVLLKPQGSHGSGDVIIKESAKAHWSKAQSKGAHKGKSHSVTIEQSRKKPPPLQRPAATAFSPTAFTVSRPPLDSPHHSRNYR